MALAELRVVADRAQQETRRCACLLSASLGKRKVSGPPDPGSASMTARGMCDARKRSTEDNWPHLGVLIGTIQRHECWNDDLRPVFREFPMLGSESTLAARAALTSRAQGLYEPFYRALLGTDGLFDLDHILAVARSVGLDAERLARDMDAPSLDALIERNAAVANALDVRGPRACVIGDGMIRGALPLEQFRAAIADARVAGFHMGNPGRKHLRQVLSLFHQSECRHSICECSMLTPNPATLLGARALLGFVAHATSGHVEEPGGGVPICPRVSVRA